MKKVFLWLPLAAMILLLSSCPTSVSTGGSLVIVLSQDMKSPTSKDPKIAASYDVLGSGPGSASFQRLGITTTSVTIDSLVPGNWGVTVNSNNYLNVPIASTRMAVTIVEGMTASAEVVSSQPVGMGKLDLSLTWTASTTISSATFTLTPQNGVPFEITLPEIKTESGVSSIQATVDVPEGFYTLSRVYKDGSSAVTWGAADALQVTTGNTTTLVMSAVDSSAVLTITPDISKDIKITFDNKDTYGNGQDITIKASPSEKVRSYQWYVNGQPQTVTTPAITFTGKTLTGRYRLDVVVSAQGALSSDGVTFTVK